MFVMAVSRQPAPVLACGATRLRHRVRPNAFGNALGDSLAAANTNGSIPGPVGADERSRILGYFADGPGTGSYGATAGQNYGFSMAAEQRLQTGQTASDAYGPVNSFDPTADRLSLSSGPNTADSMHVYVKPDGTRVMVIGDGSTPGSEGGSAGSRGTGGRGELSSSAMYAAGAGDIRETVTQITGDGDNVYMDSRGVTHIESRRMTAAEMAAFDAENGLGPVAPAPTSTGSITPIGPVDGFFTFNPAGRFVKGVAGTAYDAWTALPKAVVGVGKLAGDAVGYANNALFPQRSVLTGESIPYQPSSGLIQGIQRNGVAGTVGGGIVGAVRNAPGIGLVGSLYAPNRDWGTVGAQTFNAGVAGVGAVAGMRGASAIDFSGGESFAPGFYRADPRQLRFTQSDASPNFVDRVTGRPIGTIDSLVSDLRAGRVSADQVGSPLQVVMYEGKPFSIDNRRLVAFNAAEVRDVPIQIVSLKDPGVSARFFDRFDPIRGEGQNIVITPASGRTAAQILMRDQGLINGVQLRN